MTHERLEFVVGELLRERGLTLSVAESCTGGLVGHRLTNVPGSSNYFLGGIISYDYGIKERVLGVSLDTLTQYGAVSPQVAREMAQQVRTLFQSDVALSITGLAGPGGDIPGKPVGLTYIHLSAEGTEWSEQHVWQGNRQENKDKSAESALALLLRYLEDVPLG